MKPPARSLLLLTISWSFCGLVPLATAQHIVAPDRASSNACVSADSSSPVVVHAAQHSDPYLNLCDGHTLARVGASAIGFGSAQPLTLASGDFDEDGVPDLVSGFSSGKNGLITVHRGNVGALWPYGVALRNGTPAAFLPNPRQFPLLEAPDFVAAGDFDADGHLDLVTARRGGATLYFLKGDGHGSFRAAQSIPLEGTVTAMIAGEINRADGLADLVIAVTTSAGPRVLVYESPRGALKDEPEIFKAPSPVTALALGKFDGNAMNDLAVAAGNEIVTIHARDRRLSSSDAERASVPAARVTVQKLPFSVQALTAGDFTGAGPSVAALGDDGQIHILEHSLTENNLLAHMIADPNFRPAIETANPGRSGKTAMVAAAMAPGMAARLEALRQSAKDSDAPEWTEKDTVALPGGFSQRSPRLVAARVTGSLEEDILAPDSGNNLLHVFSTISATHHPGVMMAGRAATPTKMKLLDSLAAESAPAAVLPMRLNKSGLSGLVVLQSGQAGPVVMPQDSPPANIFTVTNTSDAIVASSQPTQYTGPDGSLRAAMFNANNATGESEIVFNIPTTDPGYNPATGTFLIQPLSEAAPGALNDFALPPINATVIIDGYTQPGASPNTLANGDNAALLIQIDGSKATTAGGSGLVPFDDVGSVYRGLVFTGWTNPDITSGSSGSTASGAEGIEANGVQDYIEGNFFGTDTTGKTAAPNRIGVFADNGPGFGSTEGGNIIGGTTPQARNILSGNSNSGVLFLSTALEAQLQGNFIGLDITGTAIVPNPTETNRSNVFDGAGLNGPTVTIGGTLPGTGNFIAGNGTNVDINDLTNGDQASDSIVQGNFIGTDATGAVGIASQGYGVSILNNPTYMLIGGTTPAARNVISGNLAGVYVFDNSFYNTVSGNYIGVDVTGTKAVPNLQQGFITGATTSSEIAAGDTTIGGSVAGAGNVISGNTMDGIQISGTSLGPDGTDTSNQGNFILGNFIGSDATGKASIPNGGNGVDLISSATNNIIGGTAPGSGNLIVNNALNGILIDPGTTAGTGTGNNTIANTIQSNAGSGVRINTGNDNRISQNSIFANGDLGINLQNAGANLNTSCNSSNTGANNLQNAPVLTAGSGSIFITATATDPNGNTSEFSNAVAATGTGTALDLLGSFNSTANTTYTIEFFSSTAADPSGYGQGQTYLTSTTVTTGASCTVPISNPVDTSQADVSVSLTSNTTQFQVGPDFGDYQFTGTVTNNGPATADNVVFTDTLPTGLVVSTLYCDVGPCQSAASSSLGDCTVNGQVITCNMGAMAPGATAQVIIPVEATAVGSLADTASVTATETDPNLANNTASLTATVDYPFPFIDHLDPVSALTQTSGNLTINVYGTGFLPTSAVTFNGAAVPTTAYLDNQVCGLPFTPGFCSDIQVSVPASLLGTASTATVVVTNPDPGPSGEPNEPTSASFTLVSSCTYDAEDFGFNPVDSSGDNLIAESISVTTNAPTCAWTAVSNAPWLVVLDNASSTGSGTIDVSVAPNTGAARSGTVTVAGQAVEIDQSAGDSTVCTYGLSPGSATIPAAGITGTIAVTAGSQCSYYVEPYPQDSTYVTGVQFITIPESSGLLVGNGTPSYTVEANHGAPRSGAIMVGGVGFPITQDAPSCYYTLSSTSANVPVGGGTGTIQVTASSPTCAWTATSSNTSLMSVISGASGTGNGSVSYSVPVNNEGPQTATITIGDANGYSIFTENQSSNFTCTFTITPGSVEVSSNGISNFFQVTASYNFCSWTAVSSDPTALTIGDVNGQAGLSTSGSATGTGVVYYRVAQNTTGAPRTITITAGCETFTVNQDGSTTTNPVPAITTLQPSSATAGSGAFTLTVNGSGFVSGAIVNFNGNARATTFVSSTQLTAAVLATDVASVGTPTVTVTNPTPGGGTSNPLTFTITAAALITPTVAVSPSPTSITTAQALSVTVTVSGGSGNPTPTGSVTLTSGTYVSAATTLSGGTATINIPAGSLTAGTDTLTVSYTPDASSTSIYNSATGTGSVTVTTPAKITPTVTVSPSPTSITTAQALSVTVTVSGGSGNPTPIGSVTLTSGTYVSAATTLVSGTATINIPAGSLTAGTDTLTVSYTPDSSSTSTYNSATGTGSVTVTTPAKTTPTVAVTPSPTSITTAQALSVTITVSGGSGNPTPTGSVTLTSGTYVSAATTLVSGTATINIPAGSLTAGTDTLTVNYTPDSSSTSTYNSATGTNTVVVTAATVQETVGTSPAGLSFSVDGTTYTSTQILTWTVGSSHTIATTSPQTTGGTQNTFVSWSDDGAISHSVIAGSLAATDTATFNTSYQLTTAASPSSGGTVSPASGTFYAAGTQVNLSATPNSGYTFTSWTGNVASASSASTIVTMSAPQSVTANFSAIPAPTFTLSAPTGSATVQPGGVATFSITATAQNGTFSNPVTLAASGLPTGATATFSPPSITPGSSSATSTLTIQTASAATAAVNRGRTWPLAATALPLLGLLLTNRKRRRWFALVVLLFASLGAVTTFSGCGGGFGFAASTSQNYSITVTGTSGTEQQTTTIQLTVQ